MPLEPGKMTFRRVPTGLALAAEHLLPRIFFGRPVSGFRMSRFPKRFTKEEPCELRRRHFRDPSLPDGLSRAAGCEAASPRGEARGSHGIQRVRLPSSRATRRPPPPRRGVLAAEEWPSYTLLSEASRR